MFLDKKKNSIIEISSDFSRIDLCYFSFETTDIYNI